MKLEKESLTILRKAVETLEDGFTGLPDLKYDHNYKRIEEIILETAEKLQNNYPYFHPFYAGQMLKPPHPVARLAYMLALWINPNNHAIDGGRESSKMEKEAVKEIAEMFGWNKYLGHLTSAGTTANLEALWIAGQIDPGKTVVASEQAHYTHSRISAVLNLNFKSIPTDKFGVLNVNLLEDMLKKEDVGMVVATAGTTGIGAVDPIPEILELKKKYNFRLHIDAAYGGYFTLSDNLTTDTKKKFNMIREADSIVIDPHKHGLQPYGCGCVLFKDPSVGRFYKHDSPYTYFTSDELHLGEISLECSRPGASAVSLWATQQLLPLEKGGEFAKNLETSHNTALFFYEKLKKSKKFKTLFPPELDILTWVPDGVSFSDISLKTDKLFKILSAENIHLAKLKLPKNIALPHLEGVSADIETVVCLRACFMKPEHFEWKEKIWNIINKTVASS